jgi:peptidoglycan/LPS O-acetylase OafA/YrhL
MQASINKRIYYPGLDAIREIAILSVLLSHYYRGNIILRFGWIGVDLFFVLSGFLITQLLIPVLQKKIQIIIYTLNIIVADLPNQKSCKKTIITAF